MDVLGQYLDEVQATMERDPQQILFGHVPGARAFANLDPMEIVVITRPDELDQGIHGRLGQASGDQLVTACAQSRITLVIERRRRPLEDLRDRRER